MKTYIKPEWEIIELKNMQSLLSGSNVINLDDDTVITDPANQLAPGLDIVDF
jgi:hypothetical protein